MSGTEAGRTAAGRTAADKTTNGTAANGVTTNLATNSVTDLVNASPARIPAPADGAARAADPVIAARRLTVSLSGRPILHGIDLTVAPGETVALLGPNGSGKSTLVRTLAGLIPADSGSVALFGTPLPRFRAWQRVGYVPQRTTAAAGVPATVGEVVASGLLTPRSWLRPRSRRDKDAVHDALDTVGMRDRFDDPVAALSGGQQQRVLIARALARRPDVLIMDEPMAGVDLASQQVFADTLARLAAAGTTILLILHELGPLAPLIGRTVVLRSGGVVYDGVPIEHGEPEHDHVHPHLGSSSVPGVPECPPGQGLLARHPVEHPVGGAAPVPGFPAEKGTSG
jgi:zinc transport system ATP-binding protein